MFRDYPRAGKRVARGIPLKGLAFADTTGIVNSSCSHLWQPSILPCMYEEDSLKKSSVEMESWCWHEERKTCISQAVLRSLRTLKVILKNFNIQK